MKISLITASFNSESTIGSTLKTVRGQLHSDIDSIIIDGASDDNTLNEICQFEVECRKRFQVRWLSEPDGGIYDAMNKGIRMATGDVIGLINSDDMLATPDVLSTVAAAFENPETNAVYGDLVYVDADDTSRVRRVWRSGFFSPQRLRRGWHPAHPTLYLRRAVYEKYGLFNLEYGSAADVEFMMRIFQRGVNACYIPEVLVRMRTGGISTRVSNVWKQNRNVLRGMRENGIRPSLFYWPTKILDRSVQFARGIISK